jgi:alkanesulfonate monooxygenase SsuD/methylene tetrahydromethanopterin reductase-like flavin-dependent oxidoreductase (luciferase family)
MTPRLRFGILPTPIYGAETPYPRQLAEHRELVSVAEQLGFSAMVCGQHFLGNELRYYQPVPYLTYLSQSAPTMTAVTGIILLSMANPVDVAEQLATLDVLTDGNSVFGVGLGYSDREFRAFGVDPKAKVARFEKGLQLIKALWSGGEVNYDDGFWAVRGARPAVLPAQKPRPPIWVGGQSEAAVRRAARVGDAWYAPPFPSHDGLAALRKVFLEERQATGQRTDGAFPVRRELLIAKTRSEAARQARQRGTLRYRTYRQWGLAGENTAAAAMPDAIDVESHFVLGPPNECADRLSAFREELGMTHFMFKPHWPGLSHREAMAQLEWFGTAVLPQLAS